MRTGKSSDNVWNRITGKSVDELWLQYKKNPGINDGVTTAILPTIESQGYSLCVDETGGHCSSLEYKRISDVFSSMYLKVSKRFDPEAPKAPKLLLDFGTTGTCAMDPLEPAMIIMNYSFLEKDTNALGYLEYYLACIALSYPQWDWLQTGFAVYSRYRYGTVSAETRWPLPLYDEKQRYSDGFDVPRDFLSGPKPSMATGW